ncbi:MAG: DUF2723 domain-containing protein [candidate division Zixibacteria bacterium]|nr:DUF2723 domain-containing protein [candidate division Zixibacteria bacterium]
MRLRLPQRFDYTNAIIAGLVWIVSLVIYNLTKAPTFSFWDCGEFVAASHILGVPHPPGTPLYILFGRIFSVIPLWSDISVRINMLSAVCSSLTALFGYLIIVRLLRVWFEFDGNLYTKVLVYAGGSAGALIAAFGLTNWNNSVEAEVYGMAMMFTMAIVWLTLIYYEHRETNFGYAIMALIVYLGILGIGVHMTVFVAMFVAGLFFIIKKSSSTGTWFAVAVFILFELYLIFALSSRPNEIPYYIPVMIIAVLYFFYMFSYERVPRMQLLIGAGFLLASLPLFGLAVSNIGGTPENETISSGISVLSLIGYSVLVLMTIWAVVILMRWVLKRNQTLAASRMLVPAWFVIAAVVAIFLLHFSKGLTPFLILSAIAVLLLLYFMRNRINWSVLIVLAAISLIVVGLKVFFYGILVALLLIICLGLARKLPDWKPALALLLFAVIGFSVHLFVPIRSSLNPNINENNPSQSVASTISFLERKQYGSQNMLERMFKRRGEWINQFGDFRRMGFWHFFKDQYGVTGPASIVLVFVGILGIWEMIRRKPKFGLPFLLLLLLLSVGLIFYMNFADGTRQLSSGRDYLEVRNRDYFFTPAFILFGFAIGIGLSVLVQTIRKSTERLSSVPRKAILSLSLLLFLTPVITLANNYHFCDRSKNFVPYDYGRNLLESTPHNGILFTHGDNDTFPLWCLQEVYGVRNDVRVINLSLANTRWYIKQVQSNIGIDLGWTDSQIDNLRPIRTRDGRYFRFQDLVMDAVIDNYAQKEAVCFSVTVGPGTRRYHARSIDSMLRLKGMVWQVSETKHPLEVDVEESIDFFLNPDRFRARGVNDTTIYMDETTTRLTRNYGNAFLMIADTLRKAGNLEKAAELAKAAIEQIPHAGDPVEFLAILYEEQVKPTELRKLIDNTWSGDRQKLNIILARTYRKDGNDSMAEDVLRTVLEDNPSYRMAFKELIKLYYENKRVDNMSRLMQTWLRFNPNDRQVKEMLKEFKSNIRSMSPNNRTTQ